MLLELRELGSCLGGCRYHNSFLFRQRLLFRRAHNPLIPLSNIFFLKKNNLWLFIYSLLNVTRELFKGFFFKFITILPALSPTLFTPHCWEGHDYGLICELTNCITVGRTVNYSLLYTWYYKRVYSIGRQEYRLANEPNSLSSKSDHFYLD